MEMALCLKKSLQLWLNFYNIRKTCKWKHVWKWQRRWEGFQKRLIHVTSDALSRGRSPGHGREVPSGSIVLEFCWPYYLNVSMSSWLSMLHIEVGTYSIMEAVLLDPSSQELCQVTRMETASSSSLKKMLLLGTILMRFKLKTTYCDSRTTDLVLYTCQSQKYNLSWLKKVYDNFIIYYNWHTYLCLNYNKLCVNWLFEI